MNVDGNISKGMDGKVKKKRSKGGNKIKKQVTNLDAQLKNVNDSHEGSDVISSNVDVNITGGLHDPDLHPIATPTAMPVLTLENVRALVKEVTTEDRDNFKNLREDIEKNKKLVQHLSLQMEITNEETKRTNEVWSKHMNGILNDCGVINREVARMGDKLKDIYSVTLDDVQKATDDVFSRIKDVLMTNEIVQLMRDIIVQEMSKTSCVLKEKDVLEIQKVIIQNSLTKNDVLDIIQREIGQGMSQNKEIKVLTQKDVLDMIQNEIGQSMSKDKEIQVLTKEDVLDIIQREIGQMRMSEIKETQILTNDNVLVGQDISERDEIKMLREEINKLKLELELLKTSKINVEENIKESVIIDLRRQVEIETKELHNILDELVGVQTDSMNEVRLEVEVLKTKLVEMVGKNEKKDKELEGLVKCGVDFVESGNVRVERVALERANVRVKELESLVNRNQAEIVHITGKWETLKSKVEKLEKLGLVAKEIKTTTSCGEMLHMNRRVDELMGEIITKGRKPMFNGKNIAPQKFLMELDKFFELLNIYKGAEKLRLFHLFLRGTALLWWKYACEDVKEWDTAKNLLLAQFFTDLEKKIYRNKWENLSWGDYIGAEEFTLRAIEIVSILKPRDDSMKRCKRVITKLPDPLRDYLLQRNIKDNKELLLQLKDVMYLKSFDSTGYFKVSTPNGPNNHGASSGNYKNKRTFYNKTFRRQSNDGSVCDYNNDDNAFDSDSVHNYDNYGNTSYNDNYNTSNPSYYRNNNFSYDNNICATAYDNAEVLYDDRGYWLDHETGYWINPNYLGSTRNYIPDFRYGVRYKNDTNYNQDVRRNTRALAPPRVVTPPRSPVRVPPSNSGRNNSSNALTKITSESIDKSNTSKH